MSPMGSSVSSAMPASPMLKHQNAVFSTRSFHCDVRA